MCLRLPLTTRPGHSCDIPEISGHVSWLPVFFLHVPEVFFLVTPGGARPHLPLPFREDCFLHPFLFQSNMFPLKGFIILECLLDDKTVPFRVSYKKKENSLVVQWLGLCAFTAGAQVQSLVRELRSREPHSVAKKKKERD